jgi:hypothetical protein
MTTSLVEFLAAAGVFSLTDEASSTRQSLEERLAELDRLKNEPIPSDGTKVDPPVEVIKST